MSEAEAAAIRTAFEQAGSELRRLFPAITDGARARGMARVIAGVEHVADASTRTKPERRLGAARSGNTESSLRITL